MLPQVSEPDEGGEGNAGWHTPSSVATGFTTRELRHGEVRHGEERHGEGRHGEERHGEGRHGEERHGEGRHGEGRHGTGLPWVFPSEPIISTPAQPPEEGPIERGIHNRIVSSSTSPSPRVARLKSQPARGDQKING
ncbi:hypothetical protein NHX12_019947 [Muraenolepis orangiensis]|uniref:Uncharacterized protein n=1 Tax=Muraenolepis orangiensis TaxID=630683 RepID=A0A9Q0EUI4_9TELE|nr:hypothetical protein NHX12_019947 [Muraenolepis orangiensis]